MKRQDVITVLACAAFAALNVGCGKDVKADPTADAPPAAQVEHVGDASIVRVDHPEQFPLTSAGSFASAAEVTATGVVAADVSRAVPVISLASGRIVEVRAKLGDPVTKGQLLMRVQSADIATAYADYRQAGADETLARAQLERSKLLLDKGAIAQKDYEVAVDTEAKSKVAVQTAQERLRVLGADQNNPSAVVDVFAPISGVITDQQVTTASGTQGLASPNPFTISDLSHVWILCDVFENDLRNVRVGEFADVRLNAYPDRVFQAKISNIGPILDPNIRAAKVRLEIANPGMMRIGMFVTAAFHGAEKQMHALVPASAVLHLHDKDWVYVPLGGKEFRRVEVAGGKMIPPDKQEIIRGLAPGDQVVNSALVLQNTSEQ